MKEKDQYINLYKKYQETLSGDDFQMGALWDDLGTQLDLDEVWLGVENELDKDKKKRRVLWIFFFGILILSSILILYFIIPEKITADNFNSVELKENNNKQDLESDQNNIINIDKNEENKIHTEIAANPNSVNLSESKETKEIKTDKINSKTSSINTSKNIPLNKTWSELNKNPTSNTNDHPMIIIPAHNNIKEITHSETSKTIGFIQTNILKEIEYEKEPYLPIQSSDKTKANKFAFGLIYNPSFLLINDNLWKSSIDDHSLVSSSLNLNQSVGGYFDYLFHRQFNIRTTFSYQHLSQDYQYYQVESSFSYVREITYFQFYKLRLGSGYKKRLAILNANFEGHLGFYLGYIKTHNGKSSAIHHHRDEIYHKMDIGLSADLGISWDIKRFNLAVGIQGDKGCRNMYKGNEEIPSYLNKTYLNSFGGFVSIGYYLN